MIILQSTYHLDYLTIILWSYHNYLEIILQKYYDHLMIIL